MLLKVDLIEGKWGSHDQKNRLNLLLVVLSISMDATVKSQLYRSCLAFLSTFKSARKRSLGYLLRNDPMNDHIMQVKIAKGNGNVLIKKI